MANRRGTYLSDEQVMSRCVSQFPTPQSLNYATMFQNSQKGKIAQAPTVPVKYMENLKYVGKGGYKLADLEHAYSYTMNTTPRESLNVTFWSTPAPIMLDRPVGSVLMGRATRMPSGAASSGAVSMGSTTTITHQGAFPEFGGGTPQTPSGQATLRQYVDSTSSPRGRGRPSERFEGYTPGGVPIYRATSGLGGLISGVATAITRQLSGESEEQMERRIALQTGAGTSFVASSILQARPQLQGGAALQAPDAPVMQGAPQVASAETAAQSALQSGSPGQSSSGDPQ
jgi:hypothetical protein